MTSKIVHRDGKNLIYFITRRGLKLVAEMDGDKVQPCKPKSIGYSATVTQNGLIDGFPYKTGTEIWVPRDNIQVEDLKYFDD